MAKVSVLKLSKRNVIEADKNFNIGTNKKLTEDSLESFNVALQQFLRDTLKNASNEKDRLKKIAVDKEIKYYKNKLDQGFEHLTTEAAINKELENTKIHMNELKALSIWSNKQSRLWKYVENEYKPILEERRQEIITINEIVVSPQLSEDEENTQSDS